MRGFRNSAFKYLVLIGATALIVVAFGYRFVVGRPTTASASEVQIPSVTIKAVEYSFDAPDTIQAGLSAFTFENGGEQDHNLKVWRLKAGTSLDDVRSAQKLKDLRALVEPYGGAGPTDPSETQQVILNLVEGQYILASTTLDADGKPGFAQGLLKPFTVVSSTTSYEEPKADVFIFQKDNASISLPATISEGKHIFELKVSPDVALPYQLIVDRLLPGKTVDDLKNWVRANRQGPSPTDEEGYGSTAEFSPGQRGWLLVDVLPGNYVVWCDQVGGGDDHFLEGEYVTFTALAK